MASFSAELRVGGHVFVLHNFTYEVHQSTDRRGRVVTKVRYGLVQMLLDVPRTDFLKAWAADPHKRWSVDLVSIDATSGQATETLHMDGAYCVFYRERFQKGDIHTGSFTLELHLSDPDGFTITAGGPAAYVAPAARDHAYKQSSQPLALSGTSARPFLKNDADPLRDVLGSGRSSHPLEWEKTIASLKGEGVDVVLRAGVMAYGPQPSPGKPGRLIIDPDASIGALRHETQHFLDDKALGFPGMQGLFAAKTRWRMEYNAYMQEVRLARDLRAFPAGKQLVSNARAEKQFITKNYGPVK